MPLDCAEEWRDIAGHEGAYQVSSLGRVRSLDRIIVQASKLGAVHPRRMRGKVLAATVKTSGHLEVALGARNRRDVHQLVALTFIGPRPVRCEVRHLDGNPTNNQAANLAWGPRGANNQDKKWHAGYTDRRLTPAEVAFIRANHEPWRKGDYPGNPRLLAARFGVCLRSIQSAAAGRTHADVTAERAAEWALKHE